MIILRQKEYSLFDLFKRKSSTPIKKIITPEEELKELKEMAPERISPSHLEAIKIEKELEKLNPNLGDGDEYPRFIINKDDWDYDDDVEPIIGKFYGCICLGSQNEPVYRWNNRGKYWEDINYGSRAKRVSNLKQDMVKYLKSELSSWENDEFNWGECDSNKVVTYLNNMINIIQKSNLK